MKSLFEGGWMAMTALLIALVIPFLAVLFGRWLTRRAGADRPVPGVSAIINRTAYRSGWRSVQIHIRPPIEDHHGAFKLDDWRIQRVILLQPRGANLARAEHDDYATGVFYPEKPVGQIEGRPSGKPQRFALEFFIKFRSSDDRGQKAKFRVIYSLMDGTTRRTMLVWATLPTDAELEAEKP